MIHKKHLNQIKSRHIDEENDTPMDVEAMEVLFDSFDVPLPRKASKTKIQKRQRGKGGIQRELTLIRKGKDINSVQSKSKKVGLYTPTYEH